MDKSIDELLKEEISKIDFKLPPGFYFLGIHFFINKKSEWSIKGFTSYPYTVWDENPMVEINLGKINLFFFNRFIWKWLDKRDKIER